MAFDYIQRLYEEVGKYEQEEPEIKVELRRQSDTFKVLKENFQGTNILEIGPATGWISIIIDKFAREKNVNFDILDFSDTYKESTKKRNLKVNKFYSGDISDINFKLDEKYDFVLFQEVIEHTVSPFTSLININNLLNEDGILYVTLPNSNWYVNILSPLYWKYKGRKSLPNTHIAEISNVGMYKLLTMTGFEVLDLRYYGSKYFIKSIGMFFTSQVGFVCKKVSKPENVWNKLTEKMVKRWL